MELTDWMIIATMAYLAKMLIVDPELQRRQLIKEKAEAKKNQSTNSNKVIQAPVHEEPDFYGIDLMDRDPDKFLKNVRLKKEKMQKGEDVAVDAMQAFFLIRNFRHSGLIAGENGTINMKIIDGDYEINEEEREKLAKKIMNFQPADRTEDDILPERKPPPYVNRVEYLKDGGVRWVYEKWHADECGLKTLCFDKFGRTMPDPDIIKDDGKNKSKGQKDSGKNEQKENAIVALSKDVAIVKEMLTDQRADALLAAHHAPPAQIIETNSPSTEEVETNNTILKPAEYISEVAKLMMDLPPPCFDDVLAEDDEEIQQEIPIENQNDENSFENEAIQFEYHEREFFLTHTASQNNFIEAVFDSVFSEDGIGFIFADFQNGQMLIEKNYLARSIRDVLLQDERKIFERDFLAKDSSEIFDGGEMNELLLKMNLIAKSFISYGRSENKMLFNILLQHRNEFVSGWFLKIKFGTRQDADSFLEKHLEDGVVIIAATPPEIKARSKLVKNVKRHH